MCYFARKLSRLVHRFVYQGYNRADHNPQSLFRLGIEEWYHCLPAGIASHFFTFTPKTRRIIRSFPWLEDPGELPWLRNTLWVVLLTLSPKSLQRSPKGVIVTTLLWNGLLKWTSSESAPTFKTVFRSYEIGILY